MGSRIYRTMYLSKGRASFSHNELMRMCAQFAAKNAQLGVTGVLVRIGNYFVQVVEGESVVVQDLLGKIKRDERHGNFTILTEHEDEKRIFAEWSMNLVDLDSNFYVNLEETKELREQIQDIVEGAPVTKRTMLSLITQVARHVRSAAPRPMIASR